MNNSIIYVFDFDGVICESVIETAITGWLAAASIWSEMPKAVPHEKISQFRLVRPIIETGYESILTMRLLFLEEPIDSIKANYAVTFKQMMSSANLTTDGLKKLFGDTRDEWITSDQDDWVRMNPLFEGVASRLKSLRQTNYWYIATTKHERFVKLILMNNGVKFTDEQIFGLDRNLTKVDVLKTLLQAHANATLYFVEDRLPTLLTVKNNEALNDIKLFFALWGYNTDDDKALAVKESVNLLQLDDFLAL